MKAGLASAVYAAEALRRAGVALEGSIEVSGTVDEESGGWAGVALLAERGRVSSRDIDFVIIPEPLNVDRICIGHRGVLVRGDHARAHRPRQHAVSGVNAVSHMGAILEAVRTELEPALATRVTEVPVVPDAARHPTINVNTVAGGQVGEMVQTPCVADRCSAIFDRRFILEEGFDATRAEILGLLERTRQRVPQLRYEVRDLMVVNPVRTPDGSRLVSTLRHGIEEVLGREASLVASPGTYDHKHFARLAGIEHCVAYGPGILDLAHQPDEWCAVDDLVGATKVLALALADLVGTA